MAKAAVVRNAVTVWEILGKSSYQPGMEVTETLAEAAFKKLSPREWQTMLSQAIASASKTGDV